MNIPGCKVLLLAWLVLEAFNPATAQVQEAWAARYHGPAGPQDSAVALALDTAGNVCVAGSSAGRYATLKYDGAGNRLWLAVLENGGSAIPTALALDASNNVYVLGTAGTVKYAPDGRQLWVMPEAIGTAIAVSSGGDIYVTGQPGSSADFLTAKYDRNGRRLWQATYNGLASGADIPVALALDAEGNAYVCGQSPQSQHNGDYATVKYDANGLELWVARYSSPGNGYDQPAAMAVDAGGNVHVTGYSMSSTCGDNSYDFATIKYDTNGQMLWCARYRSVSAWSDIAKAVALDSSGNVYVLGTAGAPPYAGDYLTLKYDAHGAQLWAARYNDPGNSSDRAQTLAVDWAGNVYVTGASGVGPNYNFTAYTTLKYDSNGNRGWLAEYTGLTTNGADTPSAMVLDATGNVYVTGMSDHPTLVSGEPSGGGSFATVKYVQSMVANSPNIASPPLSQIVTQLADVTLSVTATGDPPLSFQWFRNGVPILRGTNDVLRFAIVHSATDQGDYSVAVRNPLGIVVSPEARLIVQTTPSITSPPVRQQVLPGATATFSANADGRNLSYQWRFHGLAIPGATNCLLVLTNAQISQSGDYTLVVSNALGTLTSVVATLSVGIPAILSQPRSQSVVSGTNITLGVAAEGPAPLGFQWYFQAAPLPAATGTILALSNVAPIDSGVYHVVITNAYGGITSRVATVTVHPAVPQLDGWHRRSPPAGTRDFLNAIAHGNGNFVAVGALGTILTSSDGINWTNRTPGGSNALRGIAYGESGFVAVGTSLMGPLQAKILTSRDAATWTTQIVQTNTLLKAIAYGNGNYVAVGNSGNKGVILTSEDTLSWTSSISGNSDQLNAITYAAGRFVIATRASTPTILSSTDGLAWVRHNLQGSGSLEAIAYGNGVFVAVAPTTVWTSSDSATWTQSPGPTSWSPLAIASGYGYFVAVGYFGNLHTSPDGLTWVQRPSGTSRNLAGITFGNNSFVAVSGDDDPYAAAIIQSGAFTPIHLQISHRPDEGVELRLTGEVARTYRIQMAAAFPPTHWTDLASFTLTASATNLLDFPGRDATQRFYRAVSP